MIRQDCKHSQIQQICPFDIGCTDDGKDLYISLSVKRGSKGILVEVMGRYSNLCDQGERLRELLEMVPKGPSGRISRTNRQRQRRLRGPEINELVAGYLAGATVYELATQFSVHRHTVSDILERRDISRRYQKLTPEQVDLASALYEGGLSLIKVGEHLGRRAETVRQALVRVGVVIRPRNGW
jgi:hypothetical protein